MADEDPRVEDPGDEDRRDERIAASLRVEPLDDVTRRRLVSRALDESRRPSHALRWIAVAAAIVVVLFGALALLTAPGGNDEQRASTPARGQDRAEAANPALPAPSSPPFAAAAGAAPVDVGDLGDLSRPASLDRLRGAREGTSADAAGSASSSKSTASPTAPPCRDQLPVGTVTAVGTGTLDGRTAIAVLTVLADGSQSVDAVFTDPCEVRHLS